MVYYTNYRPVLINSMVYRPFQLLEYSTTTKFTGILIENFRFIIIQAKTGKQVEPIPKIAEAAIIERSEFLEL